MAELFQSEFNEIKLRRGVQDLNNLLVMLVEDGSITVVPDPSEEEIIEAREQTAKDAEKAQAEAEKEAEREAREREKEKASKADDTTARKAALPVAADSETAIEPTYEDVEADTANAQQKKGEPRDQKKATGR